MANRRQHAGNWPKAMIQARRASVKAGWTWTLTGTNHWAVRTPTGEHVMVVSGSFYDGPLTKKYLAALRKAGCPLR